MSTKRLFRVSLLLAVLYSSVSALNFFGGLMSASPSSIIGQAILWVLTLPALIVFGVGYGAGEGAARLTAVIVFLLVWVFCAAVVALLHPVVVRFRNGSNAS